MTTGGPSDEEFAASRLAAGSGDLWRLGTTAAFLDAVGDGSLPQSAFNRWLVQDRLFVDGFARFVALAAGRLERPARSVLVAGLGALEAELDWFDAHSRERGLSLEAEPHPVCRRYVDFLLAAAHSRRPEALLAILYGVEVAYVVAWGRLEPKGPYAEFIERWTNPVFRGYVGELMRLADDRAHSSQQGTFDEVMRHEHDFWRMTWEG